MTRRRKLRISRDTILFLVGLAGICYETLAQGGDRPTLLILFGAMVGLPAFLSSDKRDPEPKPDAKPAVEPPTPTP